MVYEIKSPKGKFTGSIYGMVWTNGIAHTDDGFTAGRLKSKGYIVKIARSGRKK